MDSTLEEAKQLELKYRNKIIELEKELDFQILRADEYENKFKQAVMANSSVQSDHSLLQQLSETQKELVKTRRELLEANRTISKLKSQTLINQNQQLGQIVEQLKNAALAALMQKQQEIESLKKNIFEMQNFNEMQLLSNKNAQLQEHLQRTTNQFTQQLKQLNEKLLQQRQVFANNLNLLQQQNKQEENQKYSLIEKTQDLECTLENMENMMHKYEDKVYQQEQEKIAIKLKFTQLQHQYKMQIDSLQTEIKYFRKTADERERDIAILKKGQETQKKQIQLLKEDKEELERKLKIKNRKNVVKNNMSIYQSFEGFSQKAQLYTSFAKPDMFTGGVQQSFIGTPTKLSQIQDIQQIEILNFNDQIELQEKQTSCSTQISHSKQQQKKDTNKKQTENLIKEIDKLHVEIERLTNLLQEERKSKIEMKQNFSKQQSLLKIDKEGLRLHIYKLENALLVEKLQNAEKLESNREIRQYEKKVFEEHIRGLKAQVDAQAPKKKKGFFK